MKRPRMRRRVFYLDAATAANLAAQAASHKVSQGAIVRARINGHRPGAEPGTAAAAADSWWDSRTPKRRVSIFRNHSTVRDDGDDHAGQPPLFEEGPEQP